MAKEKILTGTCYWLAQKLDIDPTWVRVAFLAALLFFGTGVAAYLILWIVKILEESN